MNGRTHARTSSPERWKRMSLVVMPMVTSFTVKMAGLDMQNTRCASPSLSAGEWGGGVGWMVEA